VDELFIEIPKEKGHGDFSTNIAMQAAKTVRKAPRQVAEIIIKNMDLSNTYIDGLKRQDRDLSISSLQMHGCMTF